jgi:RecA/RadA recombinase
MVKAKKEKEEIQETITEKDPAVLESALKAVEKKYGKNVVGASNSFKLKDITSIPTSSLALNMKLGRGHGKVDIPTEAYLAVLKR